ncbi:thrombin-like enzyme leucurobin [Cimex lectularius]|uniref:Peptidase S1 domain-containing protein n=1 Tax=Cimex lectularius TaxID=79782 RepID=A0A8I6SR07_CIMLE|nr:thrombin-like enzyme leucurobin [Cimex lectularius]
MFYIFNEIMLKSKFTIKFPQAVMIVTLGMVSMVSAENLNPIRASYNTRYATEGEFPFMGYMIEGNKSCGLTLISKTVTVSAGHCFVRIDKFGNTSYIDLSDTIALFGSLLRGKGEVATIKGYSVSPNFKKSKRSHFIADIGIGYLNKPLKFSNNIQPATVASTDPKEFRKAWDEVVKNKKPCFAMGWAILQHIAIQIYLNSISDFLRVSAFRVLSDEDCTKMIMVDEVNNIVPYGGICAEPMILNEDSYAGEEGAALYCEGNVFGVLTFLRVKHKFVITEFILLKEYLSHIDDGVSVKSIKKSLLFVSTILPYVITCTFIRK